MGKKWSQVQRGRAAAIVLAEPWEEESSTASVADAHAKSKFVTRRDGVKLGEGL